MTLLVVAVAVALGADPSACEAFQRTHGYTDFTEARVDILRDRRRSAAVAEAEERARETLHSNKCAGLTSAECFVLQRRTDIVGSWSSSPTDSPAWACAVAALDRGYATELRATRDPVGAKFAELASQVRELAGGAPTLAIRGPTWRLSGCATGELGASVVSLLHQGLGALGGPALAESDASPTLTLTLAVAGELLLVDGTIDSPTGPRPLAGIKLDRELLRVPDGYRGECYGTDRVAAAVASVTAVETHIAPERVHDATAVSRGHYCEGDIVALSLTADRPVRVQVFTVDRSGNATLQHERELGPGGPVRLDSFAMLHDAAAGDEQWVIVSVPRQERFSSTAGWWEASPGRRQCRVPGVFGPDLFPPGAEIQSLTYTVSAEYSGGCPEAAPVAGLTLDDLRSKMEELETCGRASR